MPIGFTEADAMAPEMQSMLLTDTSPRITKKDVQEAQGLLQKYKSGKANLERRVVEDELWWELRHWEAIGRDRVDCCGNPILRAQPTSAWLFNSLSNKHADAMDNFPEPVVLPREQSDTHSAEILSEVLPVVMESNDFDLTYSSNWWEKLKHGTAVYGVFWDSSKENGLGDIAIKQIDLLNIFWEPGVTDIQKSRNIFAVELVDTDVLERRYPQLAGKLGNAEGGGIDVQKYLYDDTVDTSEKTLVVDWYYKVFGADGQTRLHYVKFVNDEILYASENDPACRETGFYAHGEYPFVFDTLYPEKGTPVGFGFVSVCKDPQMYIDRIFGNILEYADSATMPRYFIASSTGVNEQEYLSRKQPLVHVEGTLDDTRIRQITLDPLPPIYTSILEMKIEEMKDTSANRDANSGGSPGGGITAASAIAALQEAGNKMSRDMISASYRSYSDISKLCIELMRQFYDETRTFRVTGPRGEMEFIQMSNAMLQEQPTMVSSTGEMLYRKPVFDLKVSAQKKNPFSRMEQNERAKELYQLGFFDPTRAQESLSALEMMDFEGIDDVRDRVEQGQTLFNMVQQQAQIIAQLQAALGIAAATPQMQTAAPTPSEGGAGQPAEAPAADADSISHEMMQASVPMTSYGQRLAKRSTPHV